MKKRLSEFKYRKLMLAVADAFIIAISALIASNVFDLLDDGIRTGMLWENIAVTVMTCLASLALLGAYSRLWRYFNKKDYISCICGVIFGITASCLFAYIFHDGVFVRYSMLQCLIAVCGICTFRFIFKCTFIYLDEAGRNEAKYKRTMIIGGGQACKMLLSEIRNAQNSPYTEDKSTAVFDPLCIIDDDRSKIGKTVYDVQIVGTTAEISKFISEFKIEQIIFCIPSCLEDERKRILDICAATDLPVKVIPFLGNLLFDEAHTTLLNQVRDISVEDLLGRDPITFDNADIKSFIFRQDLYGYRRRRLYRFRAGASDHKI